MALVKKHRSRAFHFSINIFVVMSSLFLKDASEACGGVTHIEISYRALDSYIDAYNNTVYNAILKQNQDALEAGNVFPDAFYPNLCFNGQFHDVAEDAHWTPFLNASINYIHRNYPKPWNEQSLKLVTFIMGVVSHQVADVSWHSLGLDQGFLQAMAGTNYHGDFPSAHSDGDLGGDVLNLFQLNLNYSNFTGEWYVPVHDLLGIFKDYYGKEVINETVVVTCTQIMFLARLAERLVVKEYYPIIAKKSPFLRNELYNYYLGGIEDMAAWTQRIWKHITYVLENGYKDCDMNHSPLLIRCNQTANTNIQEGKRTTSFRGSVIKKMYDNLLASTSLSFKDVIVEYKHGGVYLRPSSSLQEKISSLNTKNTERKKSSFVEFPNAILTIAANYSKLGSSYAVADLNKDGNDDVVIGCPGCIDPDTKKKTGIVFILYGTDQGLNLSTTDITKAAHFKIIGPLDTTNSEFGQSLAIFDLDKDGNLEIAIGAPSFGSENLTYLGRVYLYSSAGEGSFLLRGTVDCQDKYCTLGATLKSADMNSDHYSDLIVGSHYAPCGGVQRGMVGFVQADNKYAGKTNLALSPENVLCGKQDFGWFGYSVAAKNLPNTNETMLATGEPGIRKCARSNCSLDPTDVQAVGQARLNSLVDGKLMPGAVIVGVQQFQMMGGQVEIGHPFDKTSQIVAVTALGQEVTGHLADFDLDIHQAGSVLLFNWSDPSQPITYFKGDRKFGNFGAQLKFTDLNRDGIDDLIISAPERTEDITEELEGAQQGQVFVYMGGPNFPKGDATSKCDDRFMLDPCPGYKATKVLEFEEDKARFGSRMAVVKTKLKVQLLVSAEHSSKGGRLSGAIGVFNF